MLHTKYFLMPNKKAAMNQAGEILLYLARQKPELLKMKDVAGKIPSDYLTDLGLKTKIESLTN